MNRGGYRQGSGRKSSWNNPETQLIRVPRLFAAQLLQIARRLDRDSAFEAVLNEIMQQEPSDLDDAFADEAFVDDTFAEPEDVGLDSAGEPYSEFYSREALEQIAQDIIADSAIDRSESDRVAVSRALDRFIARLNP